MNKDVAISVRNLSKSFVIPCENRNTIRERLLHFNKKTTSTTFKVLDNISFEVKKGEFFSIIGRNGSGKSTLLKILAGIYTPDEGCVSVNGEISPFLELGVGFNPDLSGKDNIYLNSTILGLPKKEIDKKYKGIVEFAELEKFVHLKLKNYSSGMQVRLAFATAIQSNREILIMDEVLAVGDANFQMKCFEVFEKIIKSGRTIIFVSHDTTSVQKYSDRVLYLEEGKIACLGTPGESISKYMYSNMVKESHTADGKSHIQKESTNLEILQTRFLDHFNHETTILPADSNFRIELTFKANTSLSNLIFNLTISDSSGQHLFDSNSFAENFQSGKIDPGFFTLNYDLPNYFFPGKYMVSIAVSDSNRNIFYVMKDDLASFQVFNTNPLKVSDGIDLPHKITLGKTGQYANDNQG